MRGRTAILLTATVNPGVYAHQSGRVSQHDRYGDYVSAVNFYTSLRSARIAGVVLCENSNYDFGDLTRQLERRSVQTEIEIITFDGNEEKANVHYGYSELGIIDHAFCKSQLLRKCDSFVKISGRLILTNITELMSLIPPCTNFAVDLRRAYWREGGPPYRARTQVIYSEMQFYQDFFFQKRDQMIGMCTHIEEFIPIVISSLPNKDNILVRFPIECSIAGISGSDNKNYGSAPAKIKRAIRGAARKTIPNLWL